MERPAPAVRVIPEGALVHFALTQRQHAAVLASIKYFALKLRDPGERAVAESAWAAMSTITHFSLPSEVSVREAAPVAETGTPAQSHVPAASSARTTAKKAFGNAKGLGALTKR